MNILGLQYFIYFFCLQQVENSNPSSQESDNTTKPQSYLQSHWYFNINIKIEHKINCYLVT